MPTSPSGLARVGAIGDRPRQPSKGVRQGSAMNKRDLSEADICAKFITPAVSRAGWDEQTQIQREVHFTKGRSTSAARW